MTGHDSNRVDASDEAAPAPSQNTAGTNTAQTTPRITSQVLSSSGQPSETSAASQTIPIPAGPTTNPNENLLGSSSEGYTDLDNFDVSQCGTHLLSNVFESHG